MISGFRNNISIITAEFINKCPDTLSLTFKQYIFIIMRELDIVLLFNEKTFRKPNLGKKIFWRGEREGEITVIFSEYLFI